MAGGSAAARPLGRMGRPRDEAVDRAIMAAATELLREKGYGAFSMEGVAGRAGVAKQSIYRRWPTKGALLLDLYMQAVSGEGEKARSARGIKVDFEAYLAQTVGSLRNVAWGNTLRSLVAEAQGDDGLRRMMLEKLIEPRRDVGRRLLRGAIATGELPEACDIETLLDFAFGAIWYRLLLGHAPMDKKLVKQILNSLLARG